MSVEAKLAKYIEDPNNPTSNFDLGLEYESIGQTASAVSFYLRTAEKSDDPLLKYESLLKCGLCFNLQGSRNMTTRGLFQHAISIMPDRPEAYYFLSCFHERNQEWQESYMMASIGISMCGFEMDDLHVDIGFPGEFALIFQKGVAAWWVGMCTQSREILLDLEENYEMDELHTKCVASNLVSIGGHPKEITEYEGNMVENLRYKFDGCENIIQNYAQSYQDMFVLSMLDGKRNGTYLELGSAEPFDSNNTALLETQFGWKGVSIDFDQSKVTEFTNERDNPVICVDATIIDFTALIDSVDLGNEIDYLQIDCDPSDVTLAILLRIPFDTHKFAVITFEHDSYLDVDKDVRTKSRKYLRAAGYKLVVGDVAFNSHYAYEDWWVHPDLVSADIIKKMRDTAKGPKFCKSYMLPA